MLEDVPATTQSEETYRLENLRRYLSTLKDLGIDDERIDETLEFLGMVTGQAEPNDSLDYPFEPKPQLNEKLPGGNALFCSELGSLLCGVGRGNGARRGKASLFEGRAGRGP